MVRPSILYYLETVSEEKAGGRAGGTRAEDVKVLFKSDEDREDQE